MNDLRLDKIKCHDTNSHSYLAFIILEGKFSCVDQEIADGVSQTKWSRNIVILVTKGVMQIGHAGSFSAWEMLFKVHMQIR